MNRDNHIQDELRELNSNLPVDGNKGPFAVPEGYFDGLASAVMARVKGVENLSASEEIAQLSPLLAGISRSMPFEVPEVFFATNLEGLSAFTSDNEESLVLSFVEKEMPYSVPAGYFAGLSNQVMEKVETARPRVVKMTGRKWMRVAVAAMVAGIITVSGIVYFNGGKSAVTGNQAVTAQRTDKELKNVSTEELDAFIKTTAVTNSGAIAQTAAPKTADVKPLLNDISDKELDAFLDQVPTEDGEDAAL